MTGNWESLLIPLTTKKKSERDDLREESVDAFDILYEYLEKGYVIQMSHVVIISERQYLYVWITLGLNPGVRLPPKPGANASTNA